MRTAVVLAGLVVVVVAFLVGSGQADIRTSVLVLTLSAIVLPICWGMASDRDPWMWWVASVAFLVKMIGAAARHWVLVDTYGGVGDSVRYHNNGLELSRLWEEFSVPPLGSGTGAGTVFVDSLTGLIYSAHRPTLLGGFFIFATLAFLGQLLFYAAFRRALPGSRLGIYAAFIFFLPGIVFWPSSIGKDSLMLLFLGIASYGLARVFPSFSPVWLLVAAFGLGVAGMIRPHIAAILAFAFLLSALIGRGQWSGLVGVGRVAVLVLAAVVAVVTVSAVGERFNLEDEADVDVFASEIQRRTQQGGSAVEGEAALSLAALPSASLRVLFRPLPHEAHNLQAMANAIENTVLLGLLLWKIPAILRRIRDIRIPYVMMSAAYTVGFVIAFSTIFNLGILARQRSQVIPYLLAVLVALGWENRPVLDPNRGRHLAVTL